jgi:hypothetical protein
MDALSNAGEWLALWRNCGGRAQTRAGIEAFRLAAGMNPVSGADALKRLKEYAGTSSVAAEGEALNKPRTIAIKQSTKDFQSAEFKVLFANGKISDVRWVEGADGLKPAAEKILQSGYEQPVPSGSSVKIVGRGVLARSPHSAACMFVLFMPQDVHS